MSDYADEVEQMNFEDSMKALEGLVKELEDGGADLDRSLEIYEKAVTLRNHCKKILEESERRIQKIMDTADGIKSEEFEVN